MRKFLAIFTALVLSFITLNAASLDEIKERGTVKIGVFGDKLPFGYIDSEGKNAGYDIELAKRISLELFGDENKVEYLLVDPATRVEFLNANKVDIILANFTKTKERERVVDFASPYMKVSIGVVSKENAPIKSVDELKGKTLLINKGTTSDLYFTKNKPDAKILKFDQIAETLAAMLDGRGDALAHDNVFLFAWAKNNPGHVVAIEALGNEDVIAPAVKKGNTELLNWLNELIAKLESEKFFAAAYDKTIRPVYGDDINPESVLIEK